MSGTLVQQHKIFGEARGAQPAAARPGAHEPPAPAPLTSAELRALSAQWRQRTGQGDEAQRAQRVADVLDWLATQREPAADSAWSALGARVRQRVSGWMRL